MKMVAVYARCQNCSWVSERKVVPDSNDERYMARLRASVSAAIHQLYHLYHETEICIEKIEESED